MNTVKPDRRIFLIDYWSRKEELSRHAREWYDKMLSEHGNEIQNSVNNTVIYEGRPDNNQWKDITDTKFVLIKADTVSAVMKCDTVKTGKTAVLNFASYKHPTGGWFQGSSAQEESLCSESTLGTTILNERFKDYYDWNNRHLNYALYLDRALYSPDILFIRGNETRKADVITCAAPNWKACGKYHPEKESDNILALDDRTVFLKDMCEANNVNTFITGAWGCGVFGQNPETVCDYFLTNFSRCSLKYVIFAVPDDRTYQAFRNKGGSKLIIS